MKMPKAIVNHPAVEECVHGPTEGVDDYKYAVWLKEGWVWTNGRNEGGRGCNMQTVADFKYYKPRRKS